MMERGLERGIGGDAGVDQTPQLLAMGFRSAPDPMFVIAASNGAVVDVNDAACAATGVPRRDVVGRHVAALPLWSDPGVLGQLILQLSHDHVVRGLETRVLRADRNSPDPVQVRLTGGRLATDRSAYLICCREMREQVERGDGGSAVQRLEELGRLSGGVAHDLNNLLTIIGSYAAILRSALERGQMPRLDHLKEIEHATSRGRELAQRVVAFGRKRPIRRRLLDLNECVAKAEGLLRPLLGVRIALQFHLSPDLPRILADPVQVDQVLLNLVKNAADAMSAGGSLMVATKAYPVTATTAVGAGFSIPVGLYAMLEVRDTGNGIDEETLPRIFEPYFTTKHKDRGTGLGLAIVAGIARQAGGAVRVSSAPGSGTCVEVCWPAARPGQTAPDSVGEDASRICVLVVDDDASMRRVIRHWLEEAGYDSAEATSGESALSRLSDKWPRGSGPSIVLADVDTTASEGADFAGALFTVRPDLPLVLMSACADARHVTDTSPNGLTGYLPKPFTPRELADALEQTLQAWH